MSTVRTQVAQIRKRFTAKVAGVERITRVIERGLESGGVSCARNRTAVQQMKHAAWEAGLLARSAGPNRARYLERLKRVECKVRAIGKAVGAACAIDRGGRYGKQSRKLDSALHRARSC